jgi:peptidoglycan hydrolase-like protein with peptidoglycan-binding domain
MAKIIRLTESDLEMIVKKVIKEQSVIGAPNFGMYSMPVPDFMNKGNGNGVEAIQRALIRKGYDVGSSGADGEMGPNTKRAIMKYQKDNGLVADGKVGPLTAKSLGVQPLTSKSNTTGAKKDTTTGTSKGAAAGASKGAAAGAKNSGFILIWAFPEYEPKIDGKGKVAQFFGSLIRVTSGGGTEGTYGKLGHGGCVVIKPNGNATCYEFGRYPGAKEGYGKVLTHPLGNIAKIKNGVLTNPEEVAIAARKKTFPPGPTMSMSVAVVKLPNPSGAEKYASVKEREYSAADFSIKDEDANCGTFARDVAYAGGIDIGTFCFPTPNAVVNSFKGRADKMFQV